MKQGAYRAGRVQSKERAEEEKQGARKCKEHAVKHGEREQRACGSRERAAAGRGSNLGDVHHVPLRRVVE